MTTARWLALALFAAALAIFFYFDLGQYLTLANIKAQQAELTQLLERHPLEFILSYFAVYVLVTAVSLPGAAILTLVAGAVFGLWWGLLVVSFASTIGATLAMMLARWLFRAQVEKRFKSMLTTVNKGMEEEGAFYLFTMRLVPAIPFFAINLAMGLTKISVPVFFIVSQVGMLAGTIVYVNAGTELAQITSPADILSPGLIGAFLALGIFPLAAKRFLGYLRARRVYRNHQKPSAFDMDMVVIGAGSGGLVAALIAATVKAQVTLIEKHRMGGDCLNTGCVPSKSLIRTAKLAFESRQAADFGLTGERLGTDFAAVMQRVGN
ncbi:MAG: VTT domain-containing protein, partial [Pseudomonadales bacterium]